MNLKSLLKPTSTQFRDNVFYFIAFTYGWRFRVINVVTAFIDSKIPYLSHSNFKLSKIFHNTTTSIFSPANAIMIAVGLLLPQFTLIANYYIILNTVLNLTSKFLRDEATENAKEYKAIELLFKRTDNQTSQENTKEGKTSRVRNSFITNKHFWLLLPEALVFNLPMFVSINLVNKLVFSLDNKQLTERWIKVIQFVTNPSFGSTWLTGSLKITKIAKEMRSPEGDHYLLTLYYYFSSFKIMRLSENNYYFINTIRLHQIIADTFKVAKNNINYLSIVALSVCNTMIFSPPLSDISVSTIAFQYILYIPFTSEYALLLLNYVYSFFIGATKQPRLKEPTNYSYEYLNDLYSAAFTDQQLQAYNPLDSLSIKYRKLLDTKIADELLKDMATDPKIPKTLLEKIRSEKEPGLVLEK